MIQAEPWIGLKGRWDGHVIPLIQSKPHGLRHLQTPVSDSIVTLSRLVLNLTSNTITTTSVRKMDDKSR
jgi:hypothetical protein